MTLIKPPKLEDGFREKLAPELIKFEKPGQSIAGKLLGCTPVLMDGKPVFSYVVTLDGKKVFKFLGTYDLVQKLGAGDVGSLVIVTYLGDDNSVGVDKGNAMKVFQVQVKRDPAHDSAGDGPPDFPA